MSFAARAFAAQQDRRRRRLLIGPLLQAGAEPAGEDEKPQGTERARSHAYEPAAAGHQPDKAEPALSCVSPSGLCPSQQRALATMQRLHPTATHLALAKAPATIIGLKPKIGPAINQRWRKPLPFAAMPPGQPAQPTVMKNPGAKPATQPTSIPLPSQLHPGSAYGGKEHPTAKVAKGLAQAPAGNGYNHPWAPHQAHLDAAAKNQRYSAKGASTNAERLPAATAPLPPHPSPPPPSPLSPPSPPRAPLPDERLDALIHLLIGTINADHRSTVKGTQQPKPGSAHLSAQKPSPPASAPSAQGREQAPSPQSLLTAAAPAAAAPAANNGDAIVNTLLCVGRLNVVADALHSVAAGLAAVSGGGATCAATCAATDVPARVAEARVKVMETVRALLHGVLSVREPARGASGLRPTALRLLQLCVPLETVATAAAAADAAAVSSFFARHRKIEDVCIVALEGEGFVRESARSLYRKLASVLHAARILTVPAVAAAAPGGGNTHAGVGVGGCSADGVVSALVPERDKPKWTRLLELADAGDAAAGVVARYALYGLVLCLACPPEEGPGPGSVPGCPRLLAALAACYWTMGEMHDAPVSPRLLLSALSCGPLPSLAAFNDLLMLTRDQNPGSSPLPLPDRFSLLHLVLTSQRLAQRPASAAAWSALLALAAEASTAVAAAARCDASGSAAAATHGAGPNSTRMLNVVALELQDLISMEEARAARAGSATGTAGGQDSAWCQAVALCAAAGLRQMPASGLLAAMAPQPVSTVASAAETPPPPAPQPAMLAQAAAPPPPPPPPAPVLSPAHAWRDEEWGSDDSSGAKTPDEEPEWKVWALGAPLKAERKEVQPLAEVKTGQATQGKELGAAYSRERQAVPTPSPALNQERPRTAVGGAVQAEEAQKQPRERERKHYKVSVPGNAEPQARRVEPAASKPDEATATPAVANGAEKPAAKGAPASSTKVVSVSTGVRNDLASSGGPMDTYRGVASCVTLQFMQLYALRPPPSAAGAATGAPLAACKTVRQPAARRKAAAEPPPPARRQGSQEPDPDSDGVYPSYDVTFDGAEQAMLLLLLTYRARLRTGSAFLFQPLPLPGGSSGGSSGGGVAAAAASGGACVYAAWERESAAWREKQGEGLPMLRVWRGGALPAKTDPRFSKMDAAKSIVTVSGRGSSYAHQLKLLREGLLKRRQRRMWVQCAGVEGVRRALRALMEVRQEMQGAGSDICVAVAWADKKTYDGAAAAASRPTGQSRAAATDSDAPRAPYNMEDNVQLMEVALFGVSGECASERAVVAKMAGHTDSQQVLELLVQGCHLAAGILEHLGADSNHPARESLFMELIVLECVPNRPWEWVFSQPAAAAATAVVSGQRRAVMAT